MRPGSSGISGCGSISCASRRRGRGSTAGPTDWHSRRPGSVRATPPRTRVWPISSARTCAATGRRRGATSRPWAGVSVTELRRGGEGVELVHYRDEEGRELIDLPGAPLPDPETPAPVRFLPHWDANLLVHARRAGILPEPHRSRVFSTKNPFSVGTYLVDGVVAGAWSLRDGRIVLDPYEELSTRDARAVEREREALEAFHA